MLSADPCSPEKPCRSSLLIFRKFVRWYRKIRIKLSNRFKIKFGNNAFVGKRADFYIPQFAVIGNNVSIASDCIVQTNLIIGNECLISSRVSFIGNDHDFSSEKRSAFFSGRLPPSTIKLEGDNFIGFGSILLGNITIGRGSIVGANSLVLKDVPPFSIVVGSPARVIKKRK